MQPEKNNQTETKEVTTTPAKKTVKDWLSGTEFKAAVKAALPSHVTPERFIRVALTALMKTPKLAECSQHSLLRVMLDCSSLGLEPDGRRAHVIPYNNKKLGIYEAQLIIDYKGLIELAKRSGEIKNWRAEIVCDGDSFAWENGVVYHKIDWLKPRGKILAVYSHVRTSNDVDDYEVMTLDQVEGIRKRSRAANDGPWCTDFNEMAKKTVIRRHSKRLTLSPEFLQALEKDDDRFDEIPIDLEGAQVIEIQKSKAESIKDKLKDIKGDQVATEAPAPAHPEITDPPANFS